LDLSRHFLVSWYTWAPGFFCIQHEIPISQDGGKLGCNSDVSQDLRFVGNIGAYFGTQGPYMVLIRLITSTKKQCSLIVVYQVDPQISETPKRYILGDGFFDFIIIMESALVPL
jgi:hypothetical protein